MKNLGIYFHYKLLTQSNSLGLHLTISAQLRLSVTPMKINLCRCS